MQITSCPKCNSSDCNDYNDQFFCFECKFRNKYYENDKTRSIKGLKNVGNSFTNKLSGNRSGSKRYFQGLK